MDAVEFLGTILAMAHLIIAFATLLTSIISGALSMTGGVILMGVPSLLLPVSAAMVLHGVAQTASNGSRIVFHRTHILDPLPHWGPRCSRNLRSLNFCSAKGADFYRH